MIGHDSVKILIADTDTSILKSKFRKDIFSENKKLIANYEIVQEATIKKPDESFTTNLFFVFSLTEFVSAGGRNRIGNVVRNKL